MALLIRILVVVRLAVWVDVGPGKSSQSPPAQLRARWISALVGRMDASCLQHVTWRPVGTFPFFDEENGVGSSDTFVGGSAFADSLSEHAEVVCHAAEPPFTVWPFDKEATVHGLPGGFVNDSVAVGGWVDDGLNKFVQ
jgi:hypothetical protein